MFEITIHPQIRERTGIEALDWRRQFGLPEHDRVDRPRNYDEDMVTVEVDEDFARTWFDTRSGSSRTAAIPESLLRAGDLEEHHGYGPHYVRFNQGMSAERARGLFVAAIFHEERAAHAQIKRKAEAEHIAASDRANRLVERQRALEAERDQLRAELEDARRRLEDVEADNGQLAKRLAQIACFDLCY